MTEENGICPLDELGAIYVKLWQKKPSSVSYGGTDPVPRVSTSVDYHQLPIIIIRQQETPKTFRLLG